MTWKNFLNRLLSDGGGNENEGSKATWREKRSHNRVPLNEQERLRVHLLAEDSGEKGHTVEARVRNISLRGCHLIFENEDRPTIEPGKVYIATIEMGTTPVPLRVEAIREIGEKEIAVRFKAPFPKELEKLERFLEPRCLALSMREIDPEALQEKEKKGFRWFQGINDTNLFSWEDPETKEISQQQLIFLEKVVEWSAGKGLKTGRIQKDSESSSFSYGWVKSELMEFDSVPDPETISTAKALLDTMTIDSAVKENFLKNIG